MSEQPIVLKSWLDEAVRVAMQSPCRSKRGVVISSKVILASGISWMHLIHDPAAQVLPGAVIEGEVEGFLSDGKLGMLQIRRYSATHFHYLTAEYYHRIELVLTNAWTADSTVLRGNE